MIITKTPFRMSFFGGGTDMEEYFRENEGAVLSTTFDKYCYVNVRHLPRFFDYSTELSYSKTERVTDINDIQHPAIREAMKMLDMREIRLTYEADLPARSGLGTSSSFAVGMLNAFYALKGKYADKKKLADEAIYLERVLCNESGGWQDQIAASFGGFNRINFNSDGYEVLPVIISPERKRMLNDNLLMFFTGFTRFSSDVQKANKASSSEDKSVRLKKMYSLVDEAEAVLTDKNRNLDEFGHLLDTTWKLKKGTGGAVSTGSIDVALTTAYMNDCEPLLCFAQQVNGYGKEGDVFLGISTSGNSKNILYAAVVAKAKGMKVVALTGAKDSKLSQIADVTIKAPETRTYRIQEYHLPIYHCLCLMLEERFFGDNN